MLRKVLPAPLLFALGCFDLDSTRANPVGDAGPSGAEAGSEGGPGDAGQGSGDTGPGDADAGRDGPMATGYAAAVLEDRPKVYLRLNEASGPYARDSSGNGSDAQFRGTGFGHRAAGITADDTALTFPGCYECRLELPQGVDVSGVKPFTLELWVAPWVDYATDAGTSTHYFLLIPTPPNAGLGIHRGGLFFSRVAIPNAVAFPPASRFTHVVATYDGTEVRLYVNGALVSAWPDTNLAPAPSSTLWRIGDQLEATVDELALYDHALPDARIRAHYAAAGR